jgi:hypothetical protein
MQPLSNWQDAPMKPRPEIALKQHNWPESSKMGYQQI